MNSAKDIKNLLPKPVKNKPVEKPVAKPIEAQSKDTKNLPNASENTPKTPHQLHEEQLGNGDVIKEAVYQSFILWMSIPAAIKKIYKDTPELINQYGYDIEDPLLKQLLEIKNKGQFAKTYKISPDTVTDWLKRPDYHEKLDKLLKETVLKWKKDVDHSFIQQLIKSGDASRYKLYYQIHGGWAERQEHSGPEGGPIKIDDARTALSSRILSLAKRLREGRNNKKPDGSGGK